MEKIEAYSGAFALLLLVAGCASNQPDTQSEADMLIASGSQARTPNQTQQNKLWSLTAGQISQIQTSNRTLYVYPDWKRNKAWRWSTSKRERERPAARDFHSQ
jgi:hypothetical protein